MSMIIVKNTKKSFTTNDTNKTNDTNLRFWLSFVLFEIFVLFVFIYFQGFLINTKSGIHPAPYIIFVI